MNKPVVQHKFFYTLQTPATNEAAFPYLLFCNIFIDWM
jgi:hypothetical protein